MNQSRILIVEDEALIAAQFYRILEGAGYEALPPVSTGEDALNAVQKYRPDLILMDILLIGDLDGIQVAEKIHEIADIPVIYLTAYSDDVRLDQARVTEPYGYLIKPVEKRELLSNIKMVLYKHAIDKKLRESEERYRTVITQARELIILFDARTRRLVYGNPAFTEKLAFSTDDFRNMTLYDLIDLPPSRVDEWCIRIGGEKNCILGEVGMKGKSNTLIIAEVSASIVPGENDSTQICLIAHDVTSRKLSEEQLALSARIFRILNDSAPEDIIRRILGELKQSTGIESIGIRLSDGDDYPYYETSGFSENFVQKERYLCVYDDTKTPLRDAEGRVILECLCGNIISGRNITDSPFFTPAGSFWTNSTSDLLSSVPQEELGDRIRNRCNTEGYESVALVPLRSRGKTIGLLQFNDHRRNVFSLQMIGFLEGLGNSIGIALEKKKLDESMRLKNLAFHSARHGFILSDLFGTITSVNTAFLSLWDCPDEEEIIGMPVSLLWQDHDAGEKALEMIKEEGFWNGKAVGRKRDGTRIHIRIAAHLIRNQTSLPVGIGYLVQTGR